MRLKQWKVSFKLIHDRLNLAYFLTRFTTVIQLFFLNISVISTVVKISNFIQFHDTVQLLANFDPVQKVFAGD